MKSTVVHARAYVWVSIPSSKRVNWMKMTTADRVPFSFFSDYLAVCNFFSSKVNDTITTPFTVTTWSLTGHS